MDSLVLKNKIPILSHKAIDLLNKKEKKLSKFYKCCPQDVKCFWSGSNGQKFVKHLQTIHKKVFCSYCRFDANCGHSVDDTIESFETSSDGCHQLIDHLVQTHGRRQYQCNRCHYRAITSTHIQLHIMSTHFDIWSKNNSIITYDSLNDPNSDICKIIVCKTITFGPPFDYSVLIPKFCPKLNSDFDEKKNYCLYCDYSNEEVIRVYIHCIQRHNDFNVCHYRKDSLIDYMIPESTLEVSSDESDEDVKEVLINDPKQLAPSFKTQCTVDCRTDIPGLDDDCIPKERPPNRRPSFESHSFFDGFQPSRDVSYSPPMDDDFDDRTDSMAFEASVPQMTSNPTYSYQNYSTNPLPSTSGYNTHQNDFNFPISTSTPLPKATAITPGIPPEIDLRAIEVEFGLNKNKTKNLNKNTIQKTIANSGQSLANQTYGEYRKSKGLTTKIVHKTKRKPNPAFTYVPQRLEPEKDDYLALLESSSVPKKGIKARFENQKHYELMPIQSNQKLEKNFHKCLVCNDGKKILSNHVENHLRNVHKTNTSFKCGHCPFIGGQPLITEHSKVEHPNSKIKIVKFIVNTSQNMSIGFTSDTHLVRTIPAVAKKSTGSAPHVFKGGKGVLTQRIRESTFMGPLKNDRTDRKRLHRNDDQNQSQRVYNRSTHSSNMRKKRKISESEIFGSDCDSDDNIPMQITSSESEPMPSDSEPDIRIQYHSNRLTVAKKSTAKPSHGLENNLQTFCLTEEEIPTKFFCLFCSADYTMDNMLEAIEHYKMHLQLGYTCAKCQYKCVTYSAMTSHWTFRHPNELSINFSDNLTDVMQKWILSFLDNQMKNSDFIPYDSVYANSTGINIVCALCQRAAKVCGMTARPFDSLWKVKLHICKHLHWTPIRCDLCPDDADKFPNHPYLLMKHLVTQHFTNCENLYNISFRGQKPFNDMKAEQMRLIDKHFSTIKVISSDIINAFFNQMMKELDFNYEIQLRAKFNLEKEIRIIIRPIVQIKNEPTDGSHDSHSSRSDVKEEDKKDIKRLIKSEIKSELKTEDKDELKREVKDETKVVSKDEIKCLSDGILRRLYGDSSQEMGANATTSTACTTPAIPTTTTASKAKANTESIDCIVLSSDDES